MVLIRDCAQKRHQTGAKTLLFSHQSVDILLVAKEIIQHTKLMAKIAVRRYNVIFCAKSYSKIDDGSNQFGLAIHWICSKKLKLVIANFVQADTNQTI